MGFFLAVIMLTNLVLAVTLHPLMLVTFKPAFISGQAKTTEVRIDT
jgi:predicted RND superfamily exporter protein